MIIFKNPHILFLLPIAAILLLFFKKGTDKFPSLRFSSSELIKNIHPTWRIRLKGRLVYLRVFAVIFIIMALARPQAAVKGSPLDVKGIDIVLAIDTSGSMLAEDFNIKNERINRLNVTKTVVKNFVKERQGDRIGVVSFGSHAYTACPLTVDYDWVWQMIERLDVSITEDSTSIGFAIATSTNRLRDSIAKSKVVILLTDGRNNAGDISPQAAAEVAHVLGVKIYTIGVGSKGLAAYPFTDSLGKKIYKNISIDLDEDTLRQIAAKTKGKYFRAQDTEALKNVYKEINALEKVQIKGKRFSDYEEAFARFLIIGLIFLLLEILLKNTVLETIP